MKKLVLLSVSCLLALNVFSTQHVIINITETFMDDDITIALGDTVVFQLGNQHNVREVSLATWNANDTIALGGGFTLPLGGGMIIPTAGMHYYVCVPHASMGMKGRINVVENLGTDELSGVVFTMYPNPVSDFLNVSFTNAEDANVSYSLFNLSGQKIRSGNFPLQSVSNTFSIPVADLPRGVYMITVSTGDMQRTRRIVLQ